VISNGVVIDLEVLFEELDALSARGVDVSKLKVSSHAHVITHYHRTLDKVTERFLGKRQLGTTGRGIGPTYADKINRVGIRIQDLFDENILRQKVEGALDIKNHLLVKVYNRRAITVDEIVDDLLSYRDRLAPMVTDTALSALTLLMTAKRWCLRAARPPCWMLTTAPTLCHLLERHGGRRITGAGVAPWRLDTIVGIIKAYTTRVGSGPFPTELHDDSASGFAKKVASLAPPRVGPVAGVV
jgi:adenylosuccinate synthase